MTGEMFSLESFLWNCAWQSTIFLVAGLLGSFILRRHSARAHRVLFISMIAAIIVPATSILVKHFELGLFVAEPVVIQPSIENRAIHEVTGIISNEASKSNSAPINHDFHPAMTASEDAKFPWAAALLYTWFAASLILAARLLVTFVLGAHLLRRATPLDRDKVERAIEQVKTKLGISKDVNIYRSAKIHSPVIWCWSRVPVLLVPSTASRVDNGVDWTSVLCHELAHYKRRDHIAGLLAELTVCLLPWQPLLWMAKSRLISLSEQACDDWVVETGQSGTDYAESLLNLIPEGLMAFVPAVVRSKRGLAGRVSRILKDSCANPRTGAGWALMVSIAAICIAVSVAFAQTRPDRTENKVVHFPKDRSLGTLYIRDFGSESWYEDWERLGEAKSDMSIIPNKEVKLQINEEAAGDLSALTKLRADDLQMLSFGWKAVKIGSLAPIGNLKDLKALNLQSAKFNSEDFKHLTGLRQLEVLRLGDQQLTDSSMQYIGKLTSLRSLALWGTGISDEGLKHLQDLTNLTFLALNGCEITDRGLDYLRNMTALEGLQIYQTRITDNGLEKLRGLIRLKHINLDGNGITDAGLRHIENLTSLENIWINSNPITDKGLSYLAGMKNLKQLYALNTKITDEGITNFKRVKNIRLVVGSIADRVTPEQIESARQLIISFPEGRSMGKMFTRDSVQEDWYEGWQQLGEAKGDVSVAAGKEVKLQISEQAASDLSALDELGPDDLQMLSFGWKAMKVGSLEPIGNLKGLKALNIQCAKFDSEDFRHLTGLDRLEVLRCGDHKLTDTSMRYVGQLTSLRSLALWGTGISDEGLKHLQGLTNLTFLALNGCEISDRGLDYLRNMTALEGLQIYQTKITDRGLMNLQRFNKLKHINLGGNGITDMGLKHLENLTSLENIWIDSNPVKDEGLSYFTGMKKLKELYASDTKITDAGLVSLRGLKDFRHLLIGGIGDEGIAHLSELPALEILQIQDALITEGSIPHFKKMASIEEVLLSGDKINDDLLYALRTALPNCKIWDPQRSREYPMPAWRQRFEAVYRLEKEQILKRICPPFIPERRDYYLNEHSHQASAISRSPDSFFFHWIGKLKNWGLMFGTPSLDSTLRSVLRLKSYEYEGPKELLDMELLGDWIIRDETPQEEKLKALEQLLSDEFGRSIRFEKRTIEREVVIATGKFKFHPPSGTYESSSVHLYCDQVDSDEGAGGGTAYSVNDFLQRLGGRVKMPVIDKTDSSEQLRIPYRHHRSSRLWDVKDKVEKTRKLKMLLASLTDQTELQFKVALQPVEIWFVTEKRTNPFI